MSSNGVISFRSGWTLYSPELFPSRNPTIRESLAVAPFWSDVDIRQQGKIYYKVYTGQNPRASRLLSAVSAFIALKLPEAEDFSGVWMLVVEWNEVPPFNGEDNEATDLPVCLNCNIYHYVFIYHVFVCECRVRVYCSLNACITL